MSSVIRGSDNFDTSEAPNIIWGEEQMTDYLNSYDQVLDYSLPIGCVMTGLYSIHNNGSEDRRWKVKYRTLSVQRS